MLLGHLAGIVYFASAFIPIDLFHAGGPMVTRLALLLMLFSISTSAFSQTSQYRPVNTYSIVARDAATGQMGVAVQSHWFSVGSVVSWAEAGVGAVATQSFVEASYGPLGLELMKAGKTAQEALDALLSVDAMKDVRQVAMVDAKGNVAVHTGAKCIIAAGNATGDGFSVQANLMDNDRVWGAMKQAYENASGDLANRMLAALDAAQAEKGDIRGKQSAVILIVPAESTGNPWKDRVMELRIEDHPEPLKELRRLVVLQRAYDHMNRGDELMSENNIDEAVREYAKAHDIAPDNKEMTYWAAVTLAGVGRLDDALPMFADVFEGGDEWRRLTPRLPHSGLLPDDQALIDKILQAGR
jgi:uncharacterized Ntn-hydrolase superfamily protein